MTIAPIGIDMSINLFLIFFFNSMLNLTAVNSVGLTKLFNDTITDRSEFIEAVNPLNLTNLCKNNNTLACNQEKLLEGNSFSQSDVNHDFF